MTPTTNINAVYTHICLAGIKFPCFPLPSPCPLRPLGPHQLSSTPTVEDQEMPAKRVSD